MLSDRRCSHFRYESYITAQRNGPATHKQHSQEETQHARLKKQHDREVSAVPLELRQKGLLLARRVASLPCRWRFCAFTRAALG